MISESVTKLSITADTAFRKDLSLQGVQFESRQVPEGPPSSLSTRTARLIARLIALFRGKPAECETAQPLPCLRLTQDHQCARRPSRPRQIQVPALMFLDITRVIVSFPITLTRKWK
jgi:hypothetical protein